MENLGRINGKTELVGLLATPIGHSLSPAMHNLAFDKLGLNCAYLAFEVGNEELEDAVKGMRALNVKGFNVSMPNKMKILPYLDELADSAKFSGAVNTVVNVDGKFVGHSTDGMGYTRNLKEHGIDIKGKKMTLIGSGGAATPSPQPKPGKYSKQDSRSPITRARNSGSRTGMKPGPASRPSLICSRIRLLTSLISMLNGRNWSTI